MATPIRSARAGSASDYNSAPLLQILMENLVLHQSVYAVAELGVADSLSAGPQSAKELSKALGTDESGLHRVMRLLTSQGIFTETAPSVFANNAVSNCLRSDAPVSLRAMARFRGTDFVYRSFAEIVHTVRTGEPGRSKALGMDGWVYLQNHPEMGCIFDDAMTSVSSLVAPAIACAYDFSQWD